MPSKSRNEGKLPFNEELERFLGHLQHIEGKSQNTIDAYRRDIRDFISFVFDEFDLPVTSKPGTSASKAAQGRPTYPIPITAIWVFIRGLLQFFNHRAQRKY